MTRPREGLSLGTQQGEDSLDVVAARRGVPQSSGGQHGGVRCSNGDTSWGEMGCVCCVREENVGGKVVDGGRGRENHGTWIRIRLDRIRI